MAVETRSSRDGKTRIVSVLGTLDLTLAADLWHAQSSGGDRCRALVVDLAGAEHCADSGLRLLEILHRRGKEQGVELWLVNCSFETRLRASALGLHVC